MVASIKQKISVSKKWNRAPKRNNIYQLEQLFGNFLSKKANGSDYGPSTIRGFMSTLDWEQNNYHCPYQVNEEDVFAY